MVIIMYTHIFPLELPLVIISKCVIIKNIGKSSINKVLMSKQYMTCFINWIGLINVYIPFQLCTFEQCS